jgi:hypothetical protein
VWFAEPIAELERLALGTEVLEAGWPADAVALANGMIDSGILTLYKGLYLQQAWRLISPHTIGGIVDIVRTRILDLALSLEQLAPDTGEQGRPGPDVEELRAIVFNITGSAANIAVNSPGSTQSAELLAPGDTEALMRYLDRLGIERSDLDELEKAIEEDAAEQLPARGLGPRVAAWLGRITAKASVAAGKGALTAIGSLAGKAIAAHYGLK